MSLFIFLVGFSEYVILSFLLEYPGNPNPVSIFAESLLNGDSREKSMLQREKHCVRIFAKWCLWREKHASARCT